MLLEFLVLLSVGILVSNVIIKSYVDKLESNKCSCSEHWMRNYIKVFSVVLIIYSFVNLFGIIIANDAYRNLITNNILINFALKLIFKNAKFEI